MLSSKNVIYIATSKNNIDDRNWTKRIEKHKARRPKYWKTLESEGQLGKEILDFPLIDNILIDSLGGFVTAHINKDNTTWLKYSNEMLLALQKHNGSVIVVSEEVGWSILPHTKIGFTFSERLSIISQEIGRIANDTWLVVAGRAVNLNSIGHKVH